MIQPSGVKVQFRGVAAVSPLVAWAAGADGTFARTTDGINWTAGHVEGAEKMVFRSVVAWDAQRATLLAIGAGDASRIYHTEDGGTTWSLQFKNPDPKAFYDAIQFWDPLHGIAMSDPVDGKFRILRTSDGGKNWYVAPDAGMPAALPQEGAFAASGTCLVVQGESDAWIATGGAATSRVFHTSDRGVHWTVAATPIPAGKETSGVFGLAFRNSKCGFAVGGDYKSPASGERVVAVTTDGGQTWNTVSDIRSLQDDVHHFGEGLFEGVGFADTSTLVMVGPSRMRHAELPSPITLDDGQLVLRWHSDIGDTISGLHACSFVAGVTDPIAQVGWSVGDNGLIAKWIWQPG